MVFTSKELGAQCPSCCSHSWLFAAQKIVACLVCQQLISKGSLIIFPVPLLICLRQVNYQQICTKQLFHLPWFKCKAKWKIFLLKAVEIY